MTISSVRLGPDGIALRCVDGAEPGDPKTLIVASLGEGEDVPWDATNENEVSGDFNGCGEGHTKGLVRDPGAEAGTTKFLREDGTWEVPSFDDLADPPSLGTAADNDTGTTEGTIPLIGSGDKIAAALIFPTIPGSGTHTLKVIDGTLTWVDDNP